MTRRTVTPQGQAQYEEDEILSDEDIEEAITGLGRIRPKNVRREFTCRACFLIKPRRLEAECGLCTDCKEAS